MLVLNLESYDRISEEKVAEPRSILDLSLAEFEARFLGALNTFFIARTKAVLAAPVCILDVRRFLTEVVNLLIDAFPQVLREKAECCTGVHKAIGRRIRAG